MMRGSGFRVAGWVLHEAQWPAVLTLAIFPVLVWMYTRLARTEERDALAAFGDACTRSAANVPAFAPRVMPSRRGAITAVFAYERVFLSRWTTEGEHSGH